MFTNANREKGLGIIKLVRLKIIVNAKKNKVVLERQIFLIVKL